MSLPSKHSQPRQTNQNLLPEFSEVLPEGEQHPKLFLPSELELEAFLFLGDETERVLPLGQNLELSSPLEGNQVFYLQDKAVIVTLLKQRHKNPSLVGHLARIILFGIFIPTGILEHPLDITILNLPF